MSTRGYLGQLYSVRPILAAMEDRGMPIDDTRRQSLDAEFNLAQQELLREIATLAPADCKRVHPKEGYKGVPPEVKQHWGDTSVTAGLLDVDKVQFSDDESYHYEQRLFDFPTFDAGGNITTGYALSGEMKLRWCRVYDFNPNSSQQLLSYMKVKKHKIPKGKSEDQYGNAKDTTAKKELQRLAHRTGDGFYLKVIEYRELSKMRGTYIEGFKPHEDGRVHTTFTFDTGTGQLTCCASWTPITTLRGTIPISKVTARDFVWTHRKRWQPVTAVWIHPAEAMAEVHFSNGEVLTCTLSHKLLASTHEHRQEMADRRERAEDLGGVSKRGVSNASDYCRSIENDHSKHLLDYESSNATSRAQGPRQTALLPVEDGNKESHAGKDRRTASKLGRTSGRWLRISDLLGGVKTSIRTSESDGGRAGYSSVEVAGEIGSSSHRRRSNEQLSRQPRLDYQCGPQIHSLVAAHGGEVVTIKKVVPVGSFPVHDITVAEDESYEACGVFSHNSRNPNIQNFPKHGRLAKAVRAMVAARGDELIVEADFKSYHVLTTGFEAEDSQYMRMARLDMHSFVAGCFTGAWGPEIIGESDDALMDRFKWFKSDANRKRVRDKQAKPSILGIGFGMGYRRLYQENLEHFDGEKTAKRFHDLLRNLFPKVFEWQDRIRQLAHQQQFLRSRFGHLRRFYEVFTWNNKTGSWSPGDQAEEAVAFLPANHAFGNIRETMKEMKRQGMDEKYGLFNNIHDSFCFLLPQAQLDEFLAEVIPVLRAPSRILTHPTLAPNGLTVDVEVVAGADWANMKELSLEVGDAAKTV